MSNRIRWRQRLENFRLALSKRATQLYEQFVRRDKLEATIKKNLEGLGYGE